MEIPNSMKKLRFRGDSFQESEPLIDDDYCDELNNSKFAEMPRERGEFTKIQV